MPGPAMPGPARAWLDRPGLARLWDRLRDRLQRNGIAVRGFVVIADATHDEREALGLLMGRSYPAGQVRVSLADLDGKLRASAAGCGVAEAVAELRGELVDKPAARGAKRAERDRTWAAAEEAMRATGLAARPWASDWLAEIRHGGAVSRLPPDRAAITVTQAVSALARVDARTQDRDQEQARDGDHDREDGPAASFAAILSRGELAERVTGTAHGLDDGTVLARLVLRGIARSRGEEFPRDARARRELWEAVGAATDQVSSTVLTYGLAPLGDDWQARQLRDRAAGLAETHLTMRDLRRIEWRLAPATTVFVCENPRVVEAAVDAGCQRPLVCTSGNPSTTVLALLDALTAAGARLKYRGDFDWPGVAMASRLIRRYTAATWRMSAADYEEHVGVARDRGTPLQPLAGKPVIAEWDPELTPAMESFGVGVQEESVLELLVTDLGPRPSGSP
jgi:hypothetical protein